MHRMSRTPKAELNELAQAKNTPLEFNTELLDPNRPNDGFISVVHWNTLEVAKGYGRSKKESEHDAARQALEYLSGTELPVLEDDLDLPDERWEIYPDLLAECLRIAARTETDLEAVRENAVALYQDLLLDLGYEPEALE
jgi:Double-stranded RNA binding motif